jgi:hypothetical protein
LTFYAYLSQRKFVSKFIHILINLGHRGLSESEPESTVLIPDILHTMKGVLENVRDALTEYDGLDKNLVNNILETSINRSNADQISGGNLRHWLAKSHEWLNTLWDAVQPVRTENGTKEDLNEHENFRKKFSNLRAIFALLQVSNPYSVISKSVFTGSL